MLSRSTRTAHRVLFSTFAADSRSFPARIARALALVDAGADGCWIADLGGTGYWRTTVLLRPPAGPHDSPTWEEAKQRVRDELARATGARVPVVSWLEEDAPPDAVEVPLLAPAARAASRGLTTSMYLEAKAWLLQHDPDAQRMLEWARRDLRPPQTPERLAFEVIWIILCAGRSAQAARTIEAKVHRALAAGEPVVSAFGYRAKAAAMERAWHEREQDFAALQRVLATGDVSAIVDWCGSLPFVGEVTKFQLAKNFGVQVAKPDIWMCRLAGIPDRPIRPARERFERCQTLAKEISAASGDSVAVVDSLLWLAANKGLFQIEFNPHRVGLVAAPKTRGSVYERSPDSA